MLRGGAKNAAGQTAVFGEVCFFQKTSDVEKTMSDVEKIMSDIIQTTSDFFLSFANY